MELEYLTIPDAIGYLIEKTGREWTAPILFKLAMYKFPLYALPDKISPVVIKLFNSRNTLVSTRNIDWSMAILDGEQIEQLLQSGTTSVRYADGNDELIVTKLPEKDNPYNFEEMEYLQTSEFSPPIIVNIEMVRVSAKHIEKIVSGKIAWPIDLPPAEKKQSPSSKVAIPKQTLQENEVLDCLLKLGYTPKSLPKHPKGKTGVKGEVRTRLLENIKLFTNNSFDKAWERLRADGRVKEIN